MKRYLTVFVLLVIFMTSKSEAQSKIDIGFWTQAWYQHVENGKGDNNLNDFMLRRAYLSVKGQPTDYLSFSHTSLLTGLGRMAGQSVDGAR